MTPKPDHGTRGASQLSAYSDTGSRSSTALPMMPGTGSGQSPYPISVTPKPSPSPQPNLFDSILKGMYTFQLLLYWLFIHCKLHCQKVNIS